MSRLFVAFQRWKLSRTKPNFDPESPEIVKGIPAFPEIPDCRRCVHLTKNEMQLDEYQIHYGICNITGQSISNVGYPWQCHDFYTANRDD